MAPPKLANMDAHLALPRLVRPNKATAALWQAITAEPKCRARWRAAAIASYRQSLKDEPLPGIWPKYTARTELAMAIYQAVDEGERTVPVAFRFPALAVEIEKIDFYAIAQGFLSDDLVTQIDSGLRS